MQQVSCHFVIPTGERADFQDSSTTNHSRSKSFVRVSVCILSGRWILHAHLLPPDKLQTVHGVSAMQSGIANIPLILAQAIASLLAGVLTTIMDTICRSLSSL